MTAKRVKKRSPRQREIRLKVRPIRDRFRAALRAGERRPSVAVEGYRVSFVRLTGDLYARSPGAYLGKVSPGGIYRPSQEATAYDVEVIRSIIESPLLIAASAAKMALKKGEKPKCFCCQRELGTASDLQKGIGSKCWDNWEWEKEDQRWKRS